MTGLDFPASLADNNFVLMDPMCGSGTLAIEAALMMCNTAPGLFKYGLDTDNGSTRQAPAGRGKRTPPLPVSRWLNKNRDVNMESIWRDVYTRAAKADLRGKTKKFIETGMKKKIYVNDIHPRAVELAISGCESANVKHLIEFCCSDVHDLDLRNSGSTLPKLIITNPPVSMCNCSMRNYTYVNWFISEEGMH